MSQRVALSLLSCFSGAGGLDLGLEAAGFETIGCLESDDEARETLQLNRPHWRLLEPRDVVHAGKTLTPAGVGLCRGELDLIAGGPPCQPFSKAAQWAASANRGMADPRGRAVLGMLDLIESFLPAAVLIENVTGFLGGAGTASGYIIRRLRAINREYGTSYRLTSFVVDAADYGVAQRRQRLLGFALRDAPEPTAPPLPTHEGSHLRAADALAGVDVGETPSATGRWTPLLDLIPEGSNYQYLTSKGDGPEIFGYRTRYWSFLLKLARNKPSWTLPASPGPNTGPFHWDNRPLVPVERLALQGFPVDWKLVGDPRAGVRLAGNATPPPLAEAAGRQIASILVPDSGVRTGFSSLAKPRTDHVPSAVALTTKVPRAFASMVGPKMAHPGVGAGPGRSGSSAA